MNTKRSKSTPAPKDLNTHLLSMTSEQRSEFGREMKALVAKKRKE